MVAANKVTCFHFFFLVESLLLTIAAFSNYCCSLVVVLDACVMYTEINNPRLLLCYSSARLKYPLFFFFCFL